MNNLENSFGKKFRPRHKFSLIRNWAVHNLIGHPLAEIFWWVLLPFSRRKARTASNWIHDITIPEEETYGN